MSAHIETACAELRRFAAGLSFAAPRSAGILRGLADALQTDPEIAKTFADDVLARPVAGIRLVAGLHDLVLAGQLPELREIMYPTDPDAPPPSPQILWGLSREAFLEYAEHFQAALRWQVQQHTPDRAGLLLRGLTMLGRRRVRLLELGACAGLTLLLDRYRWRGIGWTWGAAESPLEFPVSWSAPPAGLTIVDRAGCDIAPIDPSDPTAARRLHAFIAAELTTAHTQLDTALTLARTAPVRVVRASAGQWLRGRLAETPDPDVHTVVWHSQVWHLLGAHEQDDIRTMMVEAADRFPLSRISWEPFRVGQPATLSIEDYS
jgi:hypothetical protein